MPTKGTPERQLRSALSVSFLGDSRIVIIVSIMMVAAAEMLIHYGYLQPGIILNFVILFLLTFSAIWIHESHVSISLQVLLLLPLLRLLNLTMLTFSGMSLDLFAYTYVPMLLPAYIFIKCQGLSLSGKGMFSKKIPGYILLSLVVGAIIAWGESQITQPVSLIPDTSFINLLRLSLVMICIVGFVEELIFRFLLQSQMEISFGKPEGLLIASLVFGFMHSGYVSTYEALYVFCAGLVLGYMFQNTRSLFLVSLTHGFVNVFLFGVIPFFPFIHV